MSKKNPYIRVGVDYFKVIKKVDRFGIENDELKRWNKAEIIQDHDKKFLDTIAKYDDFTLVPDNVNYQRRIRNNYNMYAPFPHIPKPGNWKWTKKLLKHVFGEQYQYGLIYLQCLYMYPQQALPVLSLISRHRSTGKSTFIDWLNIIFGHNMTVIEPDEIGKDFNYSYASKNIIAIEETLIEKSASVEKIKALSTQKFISVNMKHVSHFKLPFFGKIIMASNNEDKFIKVDDEEIRFFVRKLDKPKHSNHNILEDMTSEIPAFLYFLTKLPKPDFSRSRMVLTPEEIENDQLKNIKEHSKSGLYHDLKELLTEYFLQNPKLEEIKCTTTTIKKHFFANDSKISINYIKNVLKNDFKIENSKTAQRFNDFKMDSTVGKPYKLERSYFIAENEELTENETLNDVPF